MFDEYAVYVYSEVYVVDVFVTYPEREEGDNDGLDDHEGFDGLWCNGFLNSRARRHLCARPFREKDGNTCWICRDCTLNPGRGGHRSETRDESRIAKELAGLALRMDNP